MKDWIIPILGIVASLAVTFVAAWITLNERVTAQEVETREIKQEISRTRDRLDRYIDVHRT